MTQSDAYSYIHGGAWRDPFKDSKTILTTLPHLSSQVENIAGVAALNYRLSGYPQHLTNPSSADDPGRNACHPDHILDILTAIAWLQERFHFGEHYALVGHSAGATIAFQVVMGTWPVQGSAQDRAQNIALPMAIVGVEGIYDLEALAASFSHVDFYREFLEAAFGKQGAEWIQASPSTGKYASSWPNAKVVVLAHSQDDELVDFLQAERMSDQLWREKRVGRRDLVMSLKGKHDEVWQTGTELAKAIVTALQMLQGCK